MARSKSPKSKAKEAFEEHHAKLAKDKPFDEKMKRLTATLEEQFAESVKLEKSIQSNLEEMGWRK
jgi:hypothetical protein